MDFSREAFEADKERYAEEIRVLTEVEKLPEEHFAVRTARRRLATVDRVLSDPAYGLVEE